MFPPETVPEDIRRITAKWDPTKLTFSFRQLCVALHKRAIFDKELPDEAKVQARRKEYQALLDNVVVFLGRMTLPPRYDPSALAFKVSDSPSYIYIPPSLLYPLVLFTLPMPYPHVYLCLSRPCCYSNVCVLRSTPLSYLTPHPTSCMYLYLSTGHVVTPTPASSDLPSYLTPHTLTKHPTSLYRPCCYCNASVLRSTVTCSSKS